VKFRHTPERKLLRSGQESARRHQRRWKKGKTELVKKKGGEVCTETSKKGGHFRRPRKRGQNYRRFHLKKKKTKKNNSTESQYTFTAEGN